MNQAPSSSQYQNNHRRNITQLQTLDEELKRNELYINQRLQGTNKHDRHNDSSALGGSIAVAVNQTMNLQSVQNDIQSFNNKKNVTPSPFQNRLQSRGSQQVAVADHIKSMSRRTAGPVLMNIESMHRSKRK